MNTKENGKLKLSERLAYAIGGLPEVANSIIAAFLTMFYTDNIGLAAGMVGTMFFISKLFDGISDLVAGTIVDHTRTKWGKARPWLLWLSVPTGLSLALIFFIPQNGSSTMQLIYAFVTYNLYTTIMYTMTGIAKNALMPLMTQNMQERGILSTFAMFVGLGGTILGCSFTFPLIFSLGGDIKAWRTLFMIYGALVTIGLLIGFFFTKEYVQSVESVTNEKAEAVSFLEGTKMFVKNKYLVLALVMTVVVNLMVQLGTCSQTYFYTYSMGGPMLMTSLSLVGVVPTLISIAVLTGPCLMKFGKKKSMYIGAAGQMIGSIIKALAALSLNVPVLIVGTVIGGLATGPLSVPVATLASDGIDYGEFLFNKRIEGVGSAITSFSQKLSSGLAAAMVGWVLALTGYVANGVQNQATNIGIISLFAIIPAVLEIIIIILLKVFYHYDQEADKVLVELERRKEQVK